MAELEMSFENIEQQQATSRFGMWVFLATEVLFFGDLIGWTSPGAGPVSRHSADVWQANQGRDDFRTVLLRLPPTRTRRLRAKPLQPDFEARDASWRPALRFRP